MTRVAFWGHGKDFQGGEGRFAQTLKRSFSTCAHWWFAYNELSATVVREMGFPDNRITRVMNTIDDDSLKGWLNEITSVEIETQRNKLGLRGNNVCIFVGGMYGKKRLPFLFSACELIRKRVPDFEMIFLGDGVDRPAVEAFAERNAWVVSCGPTFGRDKALNLKLSKLVLMPGLVGLGIIDAFNAQVPLVTTDVPYHSPEIDYLLNEVNGQVVSPADSVEAFAESVICLLFDEPRRDIMKRGCYDASQKYTSQAMVNNFATGVLDALK